MGYGRDRGASRQRPSVPSGEEDRLAADMDEARHSRLTGNVKKLSRSVDVRPPILLSCSILLDESCAVDDDIDLCQMVRPDRTQF